jgi:hypothetical protein
MYGQSIYIFVPCVMQEAKGMVHYESIESSANWYLSKYDISRSMRKGGSFKGFGFK